MVSEYQQQIVITGAGVVSPVGVGIEAFAESLAQGRSGVRMIQSFDPAPLPVRIAGEVVDFEPKAYVRPRKSLKVMSRDMQFAVASARMAADQAGWAPETFDPQRVGVVMGADRIRTEFDEIVAGFAPAIRDGRFDYERYSREGIMAGYPLTFLKNLPNMLACHISIAHDARGPNNTVNHAEVSSLLAVAEAASVIQRGMADAMLCGGASSRLHPLDWARSCLMDELSHRTDAPEQAPRPFDAQRDGQVRGEGAAVVTLETRRHAEARGAKILARIAGWGAACTPPANGQPNGEAVKIAVRKALAAAKLKPQDVGHVNAHGDSTLAGDRVEAQALAEVLPGVPVTALKSYFGNLLAGGGAVELVGSLVALAQGAVPPTRNFEQPDPQCPIEVVRDRWLPSDRPTAVLVNQTPFGQAVALVLVAES